MNQAKVSGLTINSSHSIEQMECENQWYTSVFEFLNSIESARLESFEDIPLNLIFEKTCHYLNQILCFRSAAFYRADDRGNTYNLEYWQPVSREALFRRQIASVIKKGKFDWCKEPNRSQVYYDEGDKRVFSFTGHCDP